RAGLDRHLSHGPHAARTGQRGEALHHLVVEPHHGDAGILADRHGRRAGMVLDTAEGQTILVDANDRRYDADALAGVVEHAALLGMGLEVAAIPPLFQFDARRLVETGSLERIAHPAAVIAM